jgi:hypothetical protein
MSHFEEKRVPDDLLHVAERLRGERPEASGLELDRIKQRAMTRARGAQTLGTSGKGQLMRSKLVGVMLAVGVLAGGTGAMAVTGTGPGGVFKHRHTLRAAPQSQYCPPKSQRPGKPKKPRPARCGKGPKP